MMIVPNGFAARFARVSCQALAAAAIACVLVLVPSSSAWAGKVGIVARASAATSTGLDAQPPAVTFFDGTHVDLWAMTSWVATRTLSDSAIVIHEPDTGMTFEAPSDVASVEIVSFEGGAATTLGQLLDQPGAIVLFESTSVASADPYQAARFEVAYARGGSATYVARPLFVMDAPEPGMAQGIVAGLLMLMAMTSRERRQHRGMSIAR